MFVFQKYGEKLSEETTSWNILDSLGARKTATFVINNGNLLCESQSTWFPIIKILYFYSKIYQNLQIKYLNSFGTTLYF